ncbi:MAG: sodium/proline symporter [Verrucomicrobia bacterium]|nr:sodium/proline symporter [Verrucomicrobiota bacterium]
MQKEYWISFLLYFTALFGVALSVRKKDATSSDILLGSRKLNFWVTAISAQASDMSSWLFMAFPMSIFIGGLPLAWTALSLVIGMYCTWTFIAPKLRTLTEAYNCYTLSSYFAKRYGDPKNYIRISSSLLLLLFMTFYLASGLIAIGFLFGSLFEMNYYVGISIACFVMLAYTFIGGYVSVAWADLFQGIFLLASIMIVPILALSHVGGIDQIYDAAKQANISLNMFSGDINYKDILFPLFGWGLGYFGMPHILVKFMGISSASELKKARNLGISWQILALGAAVSVGLIAIAFFKNGIDNPELVFVEMVKTLFHPMAAGIVMCGMLAATISTMDSQLLVGASTITEDLYKQLIAPKISSNREVFVFRMSVLVLSAIAFWIALGKNKTIMEVVYFAWAGLGCTFGPLLLASLYSKKPNYYGALSGILTGGITAAVWPTVNGWLVNQGFSCSIMSMLVAFPLSLVTIFTVSYLTKAKAIRENS